MASGVINIPNTDRQTTKIINLDPGYRNGSYIPDTTFSVHITKYGNVINVSGNLRPTVVVPGYTWLFKIPSSIGYPTTPQSVYIHAYAGNTDYWAYFSMNENVGGEFICLNTQNYTLPTNSDYYFSFTYITD